MRAKYFNIKLSALVLLLTAYNYTLGQSLKIKWADNYGREFGVMAPTGEFSYSMLPGDKLEYEEYGDLAGQISKIGNVRIEYQRYGDLKGKVISVGSVKLEYEEYGPSKGRLWKVGGLKIEYEEYGPSKGKIYRTTGQVLY